MPERTLEAIVFVTLLSLFGGTQPALACGHAPVGVKLQPTAHAAVLIHDGTHQTIVTRLEFDIDSAAPKLGVVFAVPTVPTSYGTVGEEIFEELIAWTKPVQKSRMRSGNKGANKPLGIEQHPSVSVGPYEITPLKSSNAESVNGWLAERDLAPIPAGALQQYVDRGWTFLVVELTATAPIAGQQTLVPLRMTFPSKNLQYPVDLERPRQGAIPALFYVFTPFRTAYAKLDDLDGKTPAGLQRYERIFDYALLLQKDLFMTDTAPASVQKLLSELGSHDLWEVKAIQFPLHSPASIESLANQDPKVREQWTLDFTLPIVTRDPPFTDADVADLEVVKIARKATARAPDAPGKQTEARTPSKPQPAERPSGGQVHTARCQVATHDADRPNLLALALLFAPFCRRRARTDRKRLESRRTNRPQTNPQRVR